MKPDAQARLLAFQKQRQRRGTEGDVSTTVSKPPDNPVQRSSSSVSNHKVSPEQEPDPLAGDEILPRRTSFRLPKSGTTSTASSTASSPGSPASHPKRVNSLSERRGMKLNLSALHIDDDDPSQTQSSTKLAAVPTGPNGSGLAAANNTAGGHSLAQPYSSRPSAGTTSSNASVLSSPSLSSSSSSSTLGRSEQSQPAKSLAGAIASALNAQQSNPPKSTLAARRRAPGPTSAPPSAFAPFAKYVDIKSGSLNFAGKASVHSKGIDFSNGASFRISMDDLEIVDEIGRGNYGVVSKVLHKPTGVIMAMKQVRLELDDNKFRQILMELEVLHKCASECIVDFYGAFFVEGAVYMCIEYMQGGSLDEVYGDGIPEGELAYITLCVVKGLRKLKDEQNIIHRDVKPTNILVNNEGEVKLCDFGVSGNLVASLARTNIGCQSYMAPERIRSAHPDATTYSVQSDVWSLGLSILEIAKGGYPYPPETYGNIFSQLSAIVDGEPPELDATKFSPEARDFVKKCLARDPSDRPTYAELLQHPWLKSVDVQEGKRLMAKLVKERKGKASGPTPALHRVQLDTLNDTLTEPLTESPVDSPTQPLHLTITPDTIHMPDSA